MENSFSVFKNAKCKKSAGSLTTGVIDYVAPNLDSILPVTVTHEHPVTDERINNHEFCFFRRCS